MSTAFGSSPPLPVGAFCYHAGVSGTLTLGPLERVLQITATCVQQAGSITINGGDTIPIPYGATDKVSCDIAIVPVGDLVGPTIVFAGTAAYFVEYVKAANA